MVVMTPMFIALGASALAAPVTHRTARATSRAFCPLIQAPNPFQYEHYLDEPDAKVNDDNTPWCKVETPIGTERKLGRTACEEKRRDGQRLGQGCYKDYDYTFPRTKAQVRELGYHCKPVWKAATTPAEKDDLATSKDVYDKLHVAAGGRLPYIDRLSRCEATQSDRVQTAVCHGFKVAKGTPDWAEQNKVRMDEGWLTPFAKLKSDVECEEGYEKYLGKKGSLGACAQACRIMDGCKFFIYGKSNNKCWAELAEKVDKDGCAFRHILYPKNTYHLSWDYDRDYDIYGLNEITEELTLPMLSFQCEVNEPDAPDCPKGSNGKCDFSIDQIEGKWSFLKLMEDGDTTEISVELQFMSEIHEEEVKSLESTFERMITDTNGVEAQASFTVLGIGTEINPSYSRENARSWSRKTGETLTTWKKDTKTDTIRIKYTKRCDGKLYQFGVVGRSAIEQKRRIEVPAQTAFQCVDRENQKKWGIQHGGNFEPKCPPEACDTANDCQCCSHMRWTDDDELDHLLCPKFRPTAAPTAAPTPAPTPEPTPEHGPECPAGREQFKVPDTGALVCVERCTTKAKTKKGSWDTRWNKKLRVCGASNKLKGRCSGKVTLAKAEQICEASGAYLCSAAELDDGAGRGTGCNYDKRLVWTRDGDKGCRAGEAFQSYGMMSRRKPRCMPASSKSAYARCCAPR